MVRDDGLVLDRSSRTWPNTERIQAGVAMFELESRDPRPVFEQSGRLLLERYLSHVPRGTWIDQFAADGTPLCGYHPGLDALPCVHRLRGNAEGRGDQVERLSQAEPVSRKRHTLSSPGQ